MADDEVSAHSSSSHLITVILRQIQVHNAAKRKATGDSKERTVEGTVSSTKKAKNFNLPTRMLGGSSLASGNPSLELACLVAGDGSIFHVNVLANRKISALKKLIWDKGKRGTFHDIDASDLVVLKLSPL